MWGMDAPACVLLARMHKVLWYIFLMIEYTYLPKWNKIAGERNELYECQLSINGFTTKFVQKIFDKYSKFTVCFISSPIRECSKTESGKR